MTLCVLHIGYVKGLVPGTYVLLGTLAYRWSAPRFCFLNFLSDSAGKGGGACMCQLHGWNMETHAPSPFIMPAHLN